MPDTTKKCSKCKIVKDCSEFHKRSASKDGLRPECKSCVKKYQKNYRQEHKEERAEYHRNWYQENREEKLVFNKNYNQEHKEEILNHQKIRRQKDLNYRLTCNLRARLNSAIKNNYKSGSAVEDLGCSIEELKIWLEQQFKPGMTWDNYGRDGWHIDHIIPLSSFDSADREQVKKACHYTNLQPLWASKNISKGAKI